MSLTLLTRRVGYRLALAFAFVSLTGVLFIPSHFTGLPFIEAASTRELADLSAPSRADTIARKRVRNAYGQLPLSFELNRGQTAPEVQFLARASGYTLFLTSQEAVLSLRQSVPPTSPHLARASPAAATAVVMRMKLLGANATSSSHGEEELPARSHYLIGNDPKQWRTDIVHYQKVRYEDVYPAVDLVYRGNQGQLEYDFIVNPGADPADISLAFEGGHDVRLDTNGELVLSIGNEEIRQQRPVIYQDLDGVRTEIAGGYQLEGQKVGFHVANYDENYPLVIDPVLVYATYLGGSGTDDVRSIAVDEDGFAYVTGLTESLDFPTRSPNMQPAFGGGVYDAYVAKLNRLGTALVYATYLGGADWDIGYGIAVDDQGHTFVAGQSFSTDFPTTPGAFQQISPDLPGNMGRGNAFVTKLNRRGSAPVYSTFVGGGGGDFGRDIALNKRGYAYVTGQTLSIDFPTTPGAFQLAKAGFIDSFVTQLDAEGLSLVYSTYLGGSGITGAQAIAVDEQGYAYVVGLTYSPNFPTTRRAFQESLSGNSDAFVTKLNRRGTGLVYSTYLGGSFSPSGNEQAAGVAVDQRGFAYVTGLTQSSDFPITPGALQPFLAGSSDAFVTKLNRHGSDLIYSTYFGGTFDGSSAGGPDGGNDIAVDRDGHAYVTGLTESVDLPVTPGAFQPNYGGSVDAFVLTLDRSGESMTLSSYLGGDEFDNGLAIAVDKEGLIYVAGGTISNSFPTTSGGFQPTHAGGIFDGFVVKIGHDDDNDDNSSIFYEIVSRISDKCLDVAYASADARASVIQWSCHRGANQQWRLVPVRDGAVRIIAHHSGQVLDVDGGLADDVTPIIQYPWHGGANQLWTVEPASNGYVFIVARHSGKVLDVERGAMDDGARVIQYTGHGGANQQWLLRAVAPTAAPITTVSAHEP
jgi:hypothetical protein